MKLEELENIIDAAFDDAGALTPDTRGDIRDAVDTALYLLDAGTVRVAEKTGDDWLVNQWLKKAVLLSFRLNAMTTISSGPNDASWWDKVPSKFEGWDSARFTEAGFRAVPNCVVRRSAYIAPGVVLMPSFVNLGAYVDGGTMVDTWATVGSCAQIGKNVHISGGAGIGGVLEPLQANPVIVEDGCFIGARRGCRGCDCARGRGFVDGGFYLLFDQNCRPRHGEIHRGEVPAYSVVVPGSMPGGPDQPALSCAVIVKTVDAQTRAKTSVNDLLRD